MTALRDLLLSLLETVPLEAGGAEEGALLQVDSVELELPVEARLGPGGSFQATMPRGRVATGFDPPHGAMRVAFAWRSDEE